MVANEGMAMEEEGEGGGEKKEKKRFRNLPRHDDDRNKRNANRVTVRARAIRSKERPIAEREQKPIEMRRR